MTTCCVARVARASGWTPLAAYRLPSAIPSPWPRSAGCRPGDRAFSSASASAAESNPAAPRLTDAQIQYHGTTPLFRARFAAPAGATSATREIVFQLDAARPLAYFAAQLLDEDAGIRHVAARVADPDVIHRDPAAAAAAAASATAATTDASEASEALPSPSPSPSPTPSRVMVWSQSTPVKDILQGALPTGRLQLQVTVDDGPAATPATELVDVRLPTEAERLRLPQTALAEVQAALVPLEQEKARWDRYAARRANMLAWAGLGALSAQWGIMYYLVYQVWSWDVMEPVSYFIGAGTGILAYMFYLSTSKEYSYETLNDITISKHRLDLYTRHRFDFPHYAQLKQREQRLEQWIERIRQDYTPTVAEPVLLTDADLAAVTAEGHAALDDLSATFTAPSAAAKAA
ncbi:hypothetical protein CXG81DRAFT_24354 [Caulochytrium protostelioides]|uniref:Calcium uniporter protein, mitochondrial n=1 Tax=Caulochytrium protostelioides TaxID=1555241 RepID=A0A4P9XC75_9FUNG|nr:hypothetical protein CXG81DRAFT_24354 [Caulochytrium protostelioides]|eukprot:RKP03044.1 hypothetical protein CXG81DRAFT_24354 [Caulochytrium protostelioides]